MGLPSIAHSADWQRGARESQASVSRVPGGGTGGATKSAKKAGTRGFAAAVLTAANQEWAVDFAHDALANGRAIRVFDGGR